MKFAQGIDAQTASIANDFYGMTRRLIGFFFGAKQDVEVGQCYFLWH